MILRLLTLAGAALCVSACTATFSLPPYSPVSTEEFSSALEVNDFGYFPKEGIKQNQIRETAAGTVYITEPVGQYFANAVRRELRQAGVSFKDAACKLACKLDGEVNDFAVDSLGFSANYITDVRYILRDKSQKPLLDQSYQVKFNTSKFLVAEAIFANINKAIADNISQLLKDPAFRSGLNNCPKPTS
jgi:hypothetical protein